MYTLNFAGGQAIRDEQMLAKNGPRESVETKIFEELKFRSDDSMSQISINLHKLKVLYVL